MRVWWLTEDGIEAYDPKRAGELFKWVLFRRGGELELTSMPYGLGLDFHMQLMAETALRNGWCPALDAERFLKRDGNEFHEADIEVLGGGVRMRNGVVRNYSFRFGAVPAKHLERVCETLGF